MPLPNPAKCRIFKSNPAKCRISIEDSAKCRISIEDSAFRKILHVFAARRVTGRPSFFTWSILQGALMRVLRSKVSRCKVSGIGDSSRTQECPELPRNTRVIHSNAQTHSDTCRYDSSHVSPHALVLVHGVTILATCSQAPCCCRVPCATCRHAKRVSICVWILECACAMCCTANRCV